MTEVRYLTSAHLLSIAAYATGGRPEVRDHGLLASAAQRPGTSMFGEELYPELVDKAAALLHSLAKFHPLIDGNKRLAWLATYTFLTLNGAELIVTNDEAFDLTVAVADGTLSEVPAIAKALKPLVRAQ